MKKREENDRYSLELNVGCIQCFDILLDEREGESEEEKMNVNELRIV